jgi:hypothetical protein
LPNKSRHEGFFFCFDKHLVSLGFIGERRVFGMAFQLCRQGILLRVIDFGFAQRRIGP